MIRFIIAATFLGLFLLLSYLMFPIEWLIGKINKRAKDYSSLRIVQWGFRVILAIGGVKITVIGKENMPDEAALYVGNHRSYFDILLMYIQCKRLTGFVAKDSIGKVPSLRVWMRYLYCLFLDRKDIKQGMKTILQAIEYVKQGISICIFPEGTRNDGEELSMLPFKEGSFKIALKTGCPIVPVSINNSAEIFENHIPKMRKTHVVMEYGKPIYPKDLTREEQKAIGATCYDIIKETILRNSKLV
ncbi:MAG: 1-acyl-sn-glycerol-3-phosphate acyltransferase [Lachnospiraceae bacterium]|nr:1-acyl-sn-glycerol-3-phosphate acyltransferase [Lachnospiraceae bacterium]